MKYYNFGFVERMKVEKTRGVKRTLEYVLGFLENERKERGRGRVVGSISKMNGEKKSGPLEGSGGRRLDKLMRHLDEFGLRRSKGQRGLHAAMVGTMLAKIFEGESDAGMKAAMAKHGIKSSNQQLMCITPRRFGKTTAVAMFCAALAVSVPGVVISIFSTARRASSLLLQQIKGLLQRLPGAASKIVSSNVETIMLRDGIHNSKISSYPGQAKT